MRQKGIDLNTSFRGKKSKEGKEITKLIDGLDIDDSVECGESDLIKSLQLENLI